MIGKSFPEIAASNTKKLGLRMVAEKGHAGRAHGAKLTGREMMYKPRLRTYGWSVYETFTGLEAYVKEREDPKLVGKNNSEKKWYEVINDFHDSLTDRTLKIP